MKKHSRWIIFMLVLSLKMMYLAGNPVSTKNSANEEKRKEMKPTDPVPSQLHFNMNSSINSSDTTRMARLIQNKTKHEIACITNGWDISLGCNISGLLDALLRGYDKRLRPFMDAQKHVMVTVGFWILSIDSINVIDMDYQIDFFFRQSWRDLRLEHTYPTMLTVSNTMLEKIWLPDTYFENSKGSHFHDVTVPNKMLRIHQNGKIEYNARISVKASCPMDLRMFPMDVQACQLNIESYGYSDRDIAFRWENKSNRISIGDKVRTLPQYNLTGFRTLERHTAYVVGNWSGLTAIFVMERRTGYFFLHLYSPCALIVMISWISFCIPKESTAARVALGITSVLTITTILNMLNTAMPKVSYIKAVDWYLIVSFLFVFAVLIEYTLVLYLTDRDKQSKRKKKRHQEKKHPENQVHGNDSARKPLMNGDCHELRTRVTSSFHREVSYDPHNDHEEYDNKRQGQKPVIVIFDGHKYASDLNKQESEEKTDKLTINLGKEVHYLRVDTIDEYSRMIFPLSFATFNIVYWVLFFTMKSKGSSSFG